MEYNEKLRQLRVDSGMSQDDLAEKLHVARQTISKWEQGVNEPDIYTLKQYAVIFNVTLDELVGDVEQVSKPANKQRKACKILLLISSFFYVFCMVAVFVLFRFLQDTIPGHYDIMGAVDRYVNKSEVLLHLLPFTVFYAITLLTYQMGAKYLGTSLPNLDTTAFLVMFSIVVAVPVGYLGFVLGTTVGYLMTERLMQFIYCITGDLVLVVGLATHPKITPQNTIMGMRTKFTLTNPEAWKKTNTLTSICLPIGAALMIVVNMLTVELWLTLASPLLVLIAAAVVYVYHEVLRKKMSK